VVLCKVAPVVVLICCLCWWFFCVCVGLGGGFGLLRVLLVAVVCFHCAVLCLRGGVGWVDCCVIFARLCGVLCLRVALF